MPDTIAQDPTAPTTKGLTRRVVGVLAAPRASCGDVAADPRWLGVVLIVLVVSTAASMVFFSADVGREALFDQQIRTLEAFGRRATDVQYHGARHLRRRRRDLQCSARRPRHLQAGLCDRVAFGRGHRVADARLGAAELRARNPVGSGASGV